MTENKESASASISRGRGRGNKGFRGGRSGEGTPRAGRIPSSARGGRSNHDNRHPRQSTNSNNNDTRNKQQQTKQNHRGGRGGEGRGRGRPRSSSYNKSDCASTVKKRTGQYAHLFCSERHGFALSRVFYPRNNDQFLLPTNIKEESNSNATNSNNTRIASDSQMEQWWEAVKLVRCHVPHNETTDTNERCPICLEEEMVSPSIAPCGHKFCLPCVLGYLNSVATELNEESDRIKKNKQQNIKSNSGVVGCSTLTGRASVTSIRARCPMCTSGSSMELKAGESVITYKDLRPVVFVPVLAIAAATEEVSSNKGKKITTHRPGTRMRFVKLHRTQHCPSPYLPLAGHRIRGTTISSLSASITTESSLPDLPDGDDDREECNYTRQYFVGAEEYETILQRDLDDLNNYRQTLYCKMDSREDWNVAMSLEAVQASQRRWLGSSGDGGFRALELQQKATTGLASDQLLKTEARSDTITNEEDAKPQAISPKNSALLKSGSFHLRQKSDSNSSNCSSQGDAEEFLFYQSSDGQLCFLAGINVACLMHEFSLHRHAEGTAKDDTTINDSVTSPSTDQRPNAQLPLPDELTATVVAIEELVVTRSLIKRKHFLSHIPIGTSVYFAEIDMYSGGDGGNKPLLSHNTLSKFKGELQRRKSERLRTSKREHKADNVARAKAAKDDQRRLRELLGSHYVEGAAQQQIDPDDEFFQAPVVSFDEIGVPPSPTFRFNEVCATGGVWPELNLCEHKDTVAAHQSQPHNKTTSWGKVVSNPKVVVNSFPSLSESLATQKPQSKGNKWRS